MLVQPPFDHLCWPPLATSSEQGTRSAEACQRQEKHTFRKYFNMMNDLRCSERLYST